MDKYQVVRKKIFQALANNKNFTEILNIITESLPIDIGIFDLNLVPVESSGDNPVNIWETQFKQLLLDNNLSADTYSMKARQLLSSDSCTTLCVQDGTIQCFYVVTRLCSGGVIDGIQAIRSTSLKEDLTSIAKVTAELYSFFSENQNSQSSDIDTIRSSISKTLLEEKDGNVGLIYQAYSKGGDTRFQVEPGYCILAFRSNKVMKQNVDFQRTITHIKSIFRNSFSLITKNTLLIMVCEIQNDTITTKMQSIERLCLEDNLACGVSVYFEDLFARTECKYQAITALELALENNTSVYTANEHLYEILIAQAMQTLGDEDVLLSDVQFLAELDAREQTEYLETLEAYVNNMGHISHTAAELFIDRSTLKYRLGKISKYIDKDLLDVSVIRTLRTAIVSYRIYTAKKAYEINTNI